MTDDFSIAKKLSPRRLSTKATNVDELVTEQLAHFSIDPETEIGKTLARITGHLYHAHIDMNHLWEVTLKELSSLDRSDRITYFNAKKFMCFQLAKVLETAQHPFRKCYQSLVPRQSTRIAKGPYPIFDNISAIFSATPVITRTATYLYACVEWIDEAFQGKEMLLGVYSRLLNPTSICLANHVVDLECGPYASEYMAWNFNSGMAAIDATLSHLLGHQDVIICSRNVYGGTFQLLEDWYGKKSNLDIAVEWFDGYTAEEFLEFYQQMLDKHSDRISDGRNIYVFLESPCNPHGYVYDVPAICEAAHNNDLTVIVDSTVATPFLAQPMLHKNPALRPDFVIHSFTKDFTGTGTVTAGTVIGRHERMFIPKNETVTKENLSGKETTYKWNETLFWNVYYVKGAFLEADMAFEVMNGSRTLDLRMLRKAINTTALARTLDSHPNINVTCNALPEDPNAALRKKCLKCGLPAPLFTIDLEDVDIDREIFVRFFDSLEPAFSHMVSLGQSNTVILCPALTSHSEMSTEQLQEAGIAPTTIRISVGDEDPRTLIAHFISTASKVIDPVLPGFSDGFMSLDEIDMLYRSTYFDVHGRWLNLLPNIEEGMS